MKPNGKPRRIITVDLPADQIAWLDQQAGQLMSRSAYVRQLIAQAMERTQQ